MMHCPSKKALAVLTLGSLVGLSAHQAQGALMISLENGASTVTVTDNGAGDTDPTVGSVSFIGAVGDFDVNVTTGISKPLVGSSIQPILNLDSVNVSSAASGTLEIRMTSTDFTGPIGVAVPTTLDFGGTTNGTASIDAFVDTGNILFGTATPAGSLGAFGPGPFDDSVGGLASLTAPYSATLEATIVHDDPGDVTSFGAEFRVVPEPGSLALLGLGGLLIARRRRS